MNPVFGLAYGNSTASVAVYKEDGRVEIIANDAGDRVTATSVFISQSEKVVGLATGGNVSRLNATVTRNKSLLDTSLDQETFESIASSLVVKPLREASGDITYRVTDGDSSITITPWEVATLIFKKLHRIGQSVVGDDVQLRCVLTVPQHWDQPTRQGVQRCAATSGWVVLQLVSEPCASLLSYLPTRAPVHLTCLVYRVGGYSCEATVIKVSSGFYQILGSRRQETGVRQIIDVVTSHLADEFKRKTKLEPSDSRRCMAKLWSAGEAMVRTLSSLPTASLYLESLCEGVDFTAGLSRARLDSLLSPVLPTLLAPVHGVLGHLSLAPSDIDKVVYTGGGLNIPRLRGEVATLFSSSGATELCDYIQPQEVTAVGAANQAGLVASAFPSASALPQALTSGCAFQVRLLETPVTLKVSTGEEVSVAGALPVSKTLTVNLEEGNRLELSASQGDLRANVKFEGFDSTPTPLRLHLDLSEDSFQVKVVDLSTHLTQTSQLVLVAPA